MSDPLGGRSGRHQTHAKPTGHGAARMHWGSHITRRTIAALVAAAALAVPAQAGAATASLSGATLNVNSGNEATELTVTISGSSFVVADAGADVWAGFPCTATADAPK